MSKRQILGIIGVWVIILPFLGLPSGWKSILFVLTGIGICSLAYSTRRSSVQTDLDMESVSPSRSGGSVFVESSGGKTSSTPSMSDVVSKEDSI